MSTSIPRTTPVQETACTCAMLRRTARRVTQTYDAALRPVGLRLTQYSILANLDRAAGTAITISALAERLVMDRTTLTRNLRPLERAGWVERGPGADPRARALELTAAGRAMVERARPLWQAAERSFRAGLGPERAGALRVLLDEAARERP